MDGQLSIPSIGSKQSKIWGDTQLLYHFGNVSCHLIRFRKGGYCSRHRHRHKWNRFVVLDGCLKVVVVRVDTAAIADITTLQAGEITDVPPGVPHLFEAVEDGEALEFYWTTLDMEDIQRENMGGIR